MAEVTAWEGDLMAQCHRCLEVFTVQARGFGHKVLQADHPRLSRRDGWLRHYCGGRVSLHALLPFPEGG